MATQTPTMVVMIGIPGSGKSTFCDANFPGWRVISRDILRTRHREEQLLADTVASRLSCVIDNTNVSRAERAKFITAGKAAGYRIVGYYLRSNIAECLKRNAMRTGKARIPDAGVIGRASQLERPGYAEGFDELFYVSIQNGDFVVTPWAEDQSR